MHVNLAIPITFVIVASLSLWMIIVGRGHWLPKAAAVSASIYFSLCLFMGVNDVMGWPCSGVLPERFLMRQAVINEPANGGSEPGDIIVWLVTLNEKLEPVDERSFWSAMFGRAGKPGDPRAIRIPYSAKMHESMEKAMQMAKEGKGVYMERGHAGKKDGSGSDGMRSLSRDTEYVPHNLPPAKLPEKITN